MIALTVLFFTLGYNALQDAKPTPKNKRIYTFLKPYIPYYLEKRIGGFSIRMKNSKTKEKPPVTEVYRRLEQLEQGWGKKFLKIENDYLLLLDTKGEVVKKIKFKEPMEKIWVEKYFNIKNTK
jgi:hypothetical protein